MSGPWAGLTQQSPLHHARKPQADRSRPKGAGAPLGFSEVAGVGGAGGWDGMGCRHQGRLVPFAEKRQGMRHQAGGRGGAGLPAPPAGPALSARWSALRTWPPCPALLSSKTPETPTLAPPAPPPAARLHPASENKAPKQVSSLALSVCPVVSHPSPPWACSGRLSGTLATPTCFGPLLPHSSLLRRASGRTSGGWGVQAGSGQLRGSPLTAAPSHMRPRVGGSLKVQD